MFLGMTVGGIALYNAQWQTFFGDAVEPGLRNSVFTFRSRCLFFVGIVVPLLCGNIMTLMPDTEGKLIVLRIFFYAAGVCMLLQALVLRRIPCPPRKAEEKQEMGLKMFPEALNQMVRSKPFRGFFICIMLFYLSWHLDWSLWYIAETKYAGMNEAQLSFFQALCSICQMIFIGFFSKLCRRKSEHFTIIFVCAGLLLCPITVASMTLLPQSARMPYFMILALIGNIPQGATNMCVVQLLLQATPKKNRALIISIYTLFVTLSNSLLPFFGVSVYTALGANDTAIFTVNVIESAARFGVLIMMILRYRMMKRRGDLFRPLCEE
ncbi:MAG: MFS transporter [Hominenteromicrobium sp.]|uniref:MFS transporter n=1 Tax=Hominenteromicrobium sp. TaxID=3073581 RepID=UPI0039A2BC8E